MLLCIYNDSPIIDLKTFVPVLTACLALLGSVITWAFNEQSKRNSELQKLKEERYTKMVNTIKGFNTNKLDSTLQQQFIDELRLCWIYGSDEVVKKGNFVLESFNQPDNSIKVKAIGDLLLEMRKDVIKNQQNKTTELKAEDYKPH